MAVKNIVAQGIGFNPGSAKFMPTLGFGIGAAPTFVAPFTIRDTLKVIQSHILSGGYVRSAVLGSPLAPCQGHETEAAIVLSSSRIPIVTLGTAIKLYTVTVRLYKNMLSEPTEQIEFDLATTVQDISSDLLGDFDLGSNVRNIDAGGEFGAPMSARWGYANIGGKIHRVADIRVPIVVNDTATLSR